MRRLLGIVAALTLFPTTASAQDAVCYIEWGGQLIDLSRLCTRPTQEQSNAPAVSNLRVSDVQIAPAGDGTSLEITGIIINESSKASSLSAVRFNIIDQQSGRIVARDTAVVEAGAGLAPGQRLAFSKVISKGVLGENTNISNLRLEITGSV
jgi:hypothetical protein